MTSYLRPVSPALHKMARPLLADAWRKRTGQEASPLTLCLLGAISCTESAYGSWAFYTAGGKPVENRNNWGSIHAAPGEAATVGVDHHQDGKEFAVRFAASPSPAAGAERFVLELTAPRRPLTQAAILSGSSLAVSTAMRDERYYGGFCPKAASRFGAAAVRGMQADTDARKACRAEAIALHEARLFAQAEEIAALFGDPLPERSASPKAEGAPDCS